MKSKDEGTRTIGNGRGCRRGCGTRCDETTTTWICCAIRIVTMAAEREGNDA